MGGTGCNGHLVMRARLARGLVFSRACALGAVVASISCGDVENVEKIIDIIVSVSLSIVFFVFLIAWSFASIFGKTRMSSAQGRHAIMLFGTLMAGIFIFMTFRIDRGAEMEAGRIAEGVAERIAEGVARDMARDVARDVAEGVARDMARDVAEGVARDMARDVAEGVARDVAEGVARDAARGVARDVARDAAGQIQTTFDLMAQVDLPGNVSTLRVDSSQDLSIQRDEVEWFMFEVEERGEYQITVNSIGVSDPVICLYAQEGNSLRLLTRDDDSGVRFLDSYLSVELDSGFYYISVVEFSGADGRFVIELTTGSPLSL